MATYHVYGPTSLSEELINEIHLLNGEIVNKSPIVITGFGKDLNESNIIAAFEKHGINEIEIIKKADERP